MLAGRSHRSYEKVFARFRSFKSLADTLDVEIVERRVDMSDASGKSLVYGVGRRSIVVTGGMVSST